MERASPFFGMKIFFIYIKYTKYTLLWSAFNQSQSKLRFQLSSCVSDLLTGHNTHIYLKYATVLLGFFTVLCHLLATISIISLRIYRPNLNFAPPPNFFILSPRRISVTHFAASHVKNPKRTEG